MEGGKEIERLERERPARKRRPSLFGIVLLVYVCFWQEKKKTTPKYRFLGCLKLDRYIEMSNSQPIVKI